MIFSDNKVYEALLYVAHVILPTMAVACTAIGGVADIPHLHLIAGIVAAADAILGEFLLKSREFYHNINQGMEGDDGAVDSADESDH